MKMKRKAVKRRKSNTMPGVIDFSFDDTQYQIDTNRRKVYRNWVEVETSRTFLIMGAYSSSQVQAE
jgi:hypothetical protein